MATMNQVEQALSVLWTTQNAAERAQANDWLTAFQESAAAWEACASLLSAGSTDDTRLFGCTVLCNKLRRGCELPPAEQGALRRHLAAQLAAVAPGRLRAQLCRAVASLVIDSGQGEHPTMAMLASAEFGALRADALLEVLALVPECGAFLSDGEVLAIQELLLEVLDHACSEAAPWPAKLPPAAAPTQRSAAYRGIATHCLGKWAALPNSEGVSLAMLAEAACWPALVAAVSGADGAAAQRAAAELCTAALEREPTVPADDALAAAAAAMTMPFVPQALQLSLLTGLCDALQPLANSAAVPPPNGADADGDDDDDDEADGEAAEAQVALLSLAAGLLSRGSSVLAAGSRSPPAALQLLRVLVLCSGHRRRRVCEALIASEVWTGERSLLRVAAGWAGEADLSAQLRDTLGATLRARAALPSDSTLARWGAADVEEWTTFRDSYLSEPLAELARADAVASVRHALEQLSLRAAMVDTTGDGQADTIVPKAAAPWQPLEASLFAVEAAAEVVLSRVLAAGGVGVGAAAAVAAAAAGNGAGTTAGEGAALRAALPELLRGVLSAAADAPGSAVGASMLAAARCRLLGALSPFFAADPRGALAPTLGCLLAGAQLPAALAAEAAAVALTMLSFRCKAELAADPELLSAYIGAAHAPMPAVTLDQRCRLIEACTRTALAAPPPPPLHPLVSPLVPALELALPPLEAAAAAGAASEELAPPLVAALDMSSAALKQMRPLGGAAVAELLAMLWPAWLRVAAALAAPGARPVAAAGALESLCSMGQAAVRAAGAAFAPLLAPTAERVVVGLQHTRAPQWLVVVDALVDAFCDDASAAASFGALLDQLAAAALPALAPPAEERPDLCAALLRTCARCATLCASALARAAAAPQLVLHASRLLETSRHIDVLSQAVDFLRALGRRARYGRDPAESAALAHLLGGEAGDALLGAAIRGLPDSLPLASVPLLADVLAPLLHLPQWRAPPPPGAAETGPAARRWAVRALGALPSRKGEPSDGTKRALLAALCEAPDAYGGGGLDLELIERLREELISFARVCRGIEAAAFNIAAYDWVPAG